MDDSKKLILEMLKDGRITEDEAMALLDALKENTGKTYSKIEDEFADILNKIAAGSQSLAEKLKDYLKTVDYDDVKRKFSSAIDAIVKAVKDIKTNI